jgi:hypothetical protein
MRNVKKNEIFIECFSKLKKEKKENNFIDFVQNKKDDIDSIFNRMSIFGNVPKKQPEEVKKRYKKCKKSIFFFHLKTLFNSSNNKHNPNPEKALKPSNSNLGFDKIDSKKRDSIHLLNKYFSSNNLTNEANSGLNTEDLNKSRVNKENRKVPLIKLNGLEKVKIRLNENDSLKSDRMANTSRIGKSVSPTERDLITNIWEPKSYRMRHKISENLNLLSSSSNMGTQRKSESSNINNFNSTLYKECDKLSNNANKQILKLENKFQSKHKSKIFSQYIGNVHVSTFEKKIFKEIFNRKNKGKTLSSRFPNNQDPKKLDSLNPVKGNFPKVNDSSKKKGKELTENDSSPSIKRYIKLRNNNKTEDNKCKEINERFETYNDRMEYNSLIIRSKMNNLNQKYKEILKLKIPLN